MINQSKQYLLPLTLVLGISLLFFGCTQAKKPIHQADPPKAPSSITPPNYTPTTENQAYPREVADRAVHQANQVDGVQNSAAVISGNIIYLGLDLAPDLDKNKTAQVQKNVLARVSEPHYTVMVTSNVNTVSRIKGVSQGIAQGKPVSSFKGDIEEIGTRVRPGIREKK